MIKRTALFLFILFQINLARSQSTADSSRLPDTASIKPILNDSARARHQIRKPFMAPVDTVVIYHTDTLRFSARKPEDLSHLPLDRANLMGSQEYFNLMGNPVHVRAERYEPETYDGMFYLLVGMLFYFAIIKLFFGKYLGNLLTLFFRASMRQQQIREQVLLSPFPSLLLNNLFIFSGGLYCAFLLRFYHFGPPDRFWMHFLYSTAMLAVLYLFKFMILKITGWIFNIPRVAETYLFIVFMTNKIIGIFLLPFLVLISFAGPVVTEIVITISIIMICLFYVYRFIASYSALHKEIKISGLHFFLYLCAFEIAPLLLIYKVLVSYLEKAY